MKPHAPWSVKGIARDTRETAKEAARKQGMTVGEWLNQIIHQAGSDELGSETNNANDLDGLNAQDLVTAIDHLNRRLAKGEEASDSAIGKITMVLSRLEQRLTAMEEVTPSESSSGISPEFMRRFEAVERKSNDRERIDALRALEKAVSQIAVQFETSQKTSISRIEAAEDKLLSVTASLEHLNTQNRDVANNRQRDDANLNALSQVIPSLQKSVDMLVQRTDALEARQEEASQPPVPATPAIPGIDEQFAERTGKRLRVLGDEIKRGGDQVRSLETLIGRLADQIDASEQRSSEGLQKVTDTVTSLKSQLSQQTSNAGAGISQDAINTEIDTRLSEGLGAVNQTIDQKLNDFQETIDALKATVATSVSTADHDDSAAQAQAVFASSLTQAPTERAENAGEEELSPSLTTAFDDDWEGISQQASTLIDDQPTARAATGTLDDDEGEEEISLADDFSSSFDDLDLDDNEEPATFGMRDAPAASDRSNSFDINLDDDLEDNTAASSPFNATSEESADFLSSREAAEADEARRIAAEINQALNGIDPQAPSTPNNDALDQSSGLSPNDTSLPEPDPFEVSGETIAEPRVTAHEQLEPQQHALHQAQQEAEQQAEPSSEVSRATLAQVAGKLPRTPDGKIDIARLTPKQKAILAARARKKREDAIAAAQEAAKTTSPQASSPSGQGNPAPQTIAAQSEDSGYKTYDERYGDNSEQKSLLSTVKGLFSRKSEVDTDQAPKKKASPLSDDALAKPEHAEDFQTVVSEAKPVSHGGFFVRDGRPTLLTFVMTAVLLFLALFYAGAQLFGGGKSTNTQPSAPAPQATVGSPSSIENAGLAEAPTGEATLVRPRQVFLEAMAIFNTAPEGAVADEAFNSLTKAASLGYPPAQFQLGEFYKNGQFTEKDPVRARTWFHRSANGGNIFAMHRLGYLYAEGEGGSADILTAIDWFEQAANFGFVDSQFNLGAIYDAGAGTTPQGFQDNAKAYFWYAIAALSGDGQAGPKAAEIGARLSSAEKADIDTQIERWRAQPVDKSANENLSEG